MTADPTPENVADKARGRLVILSDVGGTSVPLGTLAWDTEDGRVPCRIEGDATGEIRRIMEAVRIDASINERSFFPLAQVYAALSERGLRAEDITSGDIKITFELSMETGRIVGTAGPLRPFTPPNDMSRQIFAAMERAARQPMDDLATRLRGAVDAAEAVVVLKQAQAEGLLGSFPTADLLAVLETVDLSSADPGSREFLRRARLEVAQRLRRHETVAAEAEALLAESPTAFSAEEKAELEMAIAIGLAQKGRTEAALSIWGRLLSADTPLSAEGRAWAWRNISLALPLSNPEAKAAAQHSADTFLQAGNKRQAGASLLRVADCLMTEAPESALDALNQMFALVEQEGIGNRELRAAVYHARANRLLTLRKAFLALQDAKQAIAIRRELLGVDQQLVSSLHLAAVALMILGQKDEAKLYSDEADALTRKEGISHFDIANQVMSLFESFDSELAGRPEKDARSSGNWEHASGVVVARAMHDPKLTQEERLGMLEGLLLELRDVNAEGDIRKPARRAIAQMLTKMGKSDRAVGWWRDLARDHPWDDHIVGSLFNCYSALMSWAEAEKLMRAQIALRGERPGILFLLGKVLHNDGQMSEAVTVLHKAARLAGEDSNLKRHILELRDEAMDAGGTILPEAQPAPPKGIGRVQLEAALNEFASHIAATQRMGFWQTKDRKRNWVQNPEKLAKGQLHTFLQAKYGDQIAVFTEIAAGAGRLDLYLQLAGGLSVIVELKMCGAGYASSYASAGEDQILHYMENRDTRLGYLVVFDARTEKFGESVLAPRKADCYTVYEKFVDVRPNWPRTPKGKQRQGNDRCRAD
jgi:tetratricopeptide (TPR) repeat protein